MRNYHLMSSLARADRDELSLGHGYVDVAQVIEQIEKATLIKISLKSKIHGLNVVKGKAKLVLINSEETLGRQRYTMAHELYHLRHDGSNNDDTDRLANIYASYFLMPKESLEDKFSSVGGVITIDTIFEISQFFKISFGAVAFRLKKERYISRDDYNTYKEINVISEAIKRGHSLELYKPTKEPFSISTPFLPLIQRLHQDNYLSDSQFLNYIENNSLDSVIEKIKETETKEDDSYEF